MPPSRPRAVRPGLDHCAEVGVVDAPVKRFRPGSGPGEQATRGDVAGRRPATRRDQRASAPSVGSTLLDGPGAVERAERGRGKSRLAAMQAASRLTSRTITYWIARR